MYFVDRTAVVLKPTEQFLQWLKQSDDNMPDLTLAQLRTNCSVFLVPEFDQPEEVVAYFDERYQQIFEAEISGWGYSFRQMAAGYEPESLLGIFRSGNSRYGAGYGRGRYFG